MWISKNLCEQFRLCKLFGEVGMFCYFVGKACFEKLILIFMYRGGEGGIVDIRVAYEWVVRIISWVKRVYNDVSYY